MTPQPSRPLSQPLVVVIDTSDSPRSRSRAGSDVAVVYLLEHGAEVIRIDASRWPLANQHGDSVEIAHAAKLVASASAVLLSGPVHDWTPAAASLNALVAILDGDSQPYRPFAFIGGAGGPRALLAWDVAHRMVTSEANALVVGRTVLVVGDDLDESGRVTAPVAERICRTAGALLRHARVFREALVTEAA